MKEGGISQVCTLSSFLSVNASQFLGPKNKKIKEEKKIKQCVSVPDAWSGHLMELFKKHARINASL